MATLSEITKLDPELLHEKFELEPRNRYDPKHSDNLEFLSPLILLEDLKLREGGFQDRGAKEVLSRVAKKICESKDPSLLQIPEIPYLHMGYGKKSENKKDQMALDKEDAEVWMGFLNLSRFTRERIPDEESTLSEGEIAMEIDFPTPRDTQALDTEGLELEDTQAADPEGLEADAEELVRPNDSGLQIPLKGSYILLFSILLIFFDKKKKQKKSAGSTDEEAKIGANKISDFLLFWILPYLLNFTHQKVREIVKHHKEVNNFDFQAVVKKSTLDIIQDAMASCHVSAELREAIMTNYKDFYGTEQLEYKYNLLESKDGTPVILVPKCYKVTEMPAKLEDIGSTWRELGNVKLLDEFMSKFIKNKAIQEDFLSSLPLLRHHQGVDYAILLPDEKTFNELIGQLENQSCEYFSSPRKMKKGGRYLSKVRIGLVTATEKHLAVSFSYIQGN